MIRPKCILCGVDLKHPYETKEIDGKPIEVLVEEQVNLWIHDPRNTHVDVNITLHKSCYDKIKALYPNIDKVTSLKGTAIRYPVLEGETLVLKTLSEFLTLNRI